jgi:hypothetical protein|tara:strand:- start:132 stop:362 length:231 start_codon:yes stop_codon:yes gene_type:complete
MSGHTPNKRRLCGLFSLVAAYSSGGLLLLFLWASLKVTPNEREMVDLEDETGSSPDFEEFEVRPNLTDSENCGVVG